MATIFDGIAAFGLMNPDKHAITCVANTQQKRRCRNPIAYRDVNAAKQILATITAYAGDTVRLQRRLRDLAALCICKNSRNGHLSQRDDIVNEWMAIMHAVGLGEQRRHLSTPLRPVDPYSAGGLQIKGAVTSIGESHHTTHATTPHHDSTSSSNTADKHGTAIFPSYYRHNCRRLCFGTSSS
ncbi:hypothetical protein LTR86_000927 [Recurvomyces mirabilis]|nr:hypothetical protein LTR86_000927 [Recurvomyces mirabilis]